MPNYIFFPKINDLVFLLPHHHLPGPLSHWCRFLFCLPVNSAPLEMLSSVCITLVLEPKPHEIPVVDGVTNRLKTYITTIVYCAFSLPSVIQNLILSSRSISNIFSGQKTPIHMYTGSELCHLYSL